jgi:hypothetical protein
LVAVALLAGIQDSIAAGIDGVVFLFAGKCKKGQKETHHNLESAIG